MITVIILKMKKYWYNSKRDKERKEAYCINYKIITLKVIGHGSLLISKEPEPYENDEYENGCAYSQLGSH